jgi:adenine-specific DNA-methyltransferase
MASVPVDLPETFNYLIGLSVRTTRRDGEILCICGRTRDGTETAVIWCDAPQAKRDRALQKWAKTNAAVLKECERVYVNGDCSLRGARPIEVEFRRRMLPGGDNSLGD